jgi:hypothetical protein
MSLKPFRRNDDGCTGLVWSGVEKMWICGDSMGQLFRINPADKTFSSMDLLNNPVCSLCLDPQNEKLFIGTEQSVEIKTFPDTSSLEHMKLIASVTLPATQLKLSSNSKFL